MLMFIAMRTIEFKASPYTDMAAHIVRLAGVGSGDILYGHALQHRFVFTELLKLEERPIIAVLPRVRLCGFALPGILSDAAKVFEAQSAIEPLRQANNLLGDAMIDVGDDTSFLAFHLLDGAHLTGLLKLLPPLGKLAAKMGNPARFEEKHASVVRQSSNRRYLLPTVNTNPLVRLFRVGNIHRHGYADIPSVLTRTPQLDRALLRGPGNHRIQPFGVDGLVNGQRDALPNAAKHSKAHAVGVSDLVQGPVLIVGLKRQAIEFLDFRSGASVADRLVYPGRANLNRVEMLGGERGAFVSRHRQNRVRHFGIHGLQTRKFFRLRFIQAKKRKLQCFCRVCHTAKYRLSYNGLQDMICKKEPYIPMPEGRGFTAVSVIKP
jgi:hypothetical protein